MCYSFDGKGEDLVRISVILFSEEWRVRNYMKPEGSHLTK